MGELVSFAAFRARRAAAAAARMRLAAAHPALRWIVPDEHPLRAHRRTAIGEALCGAGPVRLTISLTEEAAPWCLRCRPPC